jgi:hypothetical protein
MVIQTKALSWAEPVQGCARLCMGSVNQKTREAGGREKQSNKREKEHRRSSVPAAHLLSFLQSAHHPTNAMLPGLSLALEAFIVPRGRQI